MPISDEIHDNKANTSFVFRVLEKALENHNIKLILTEKETEI